MSTGHAQYGTSHIPVKTVYFAGSTQLRDGQALCYEPLDDSNVNAPGTASTDKSSWLGMYCNTVDAANKNTFAGFVTPSSAGKTGPCWCDVHVPRPGDVLQVELDGTTDVAVDDSLELDATLLGMIKDATVAAGVWPRAYAQEAYTTNATLAKKWVYFY